MAEQDIPQPVEINPEEPVEIKPNITKDSSPAEIEAFVIGSLIEQAKKDGRVFENHDQAVLWAKKKMEHIMEKERRKGIPIKCHFCGQGGANAETGPLRKTHVGYIHEHCGEN